MSKEKPLQWLRPDQGRYVKEFKPVPPQRVGDGEWKIAVHTLHKGLRDPRYYLKAELYQQLGDAEMHIQKVESLNRSLNEELNARESAWKQEEQDWNIRNELLADRLRVRARRERLWKISVVVLVILVAIMLWAFFEVFTS